MFLKVIETKVILPGRHGNHVVNLHKPVLHEPIVTLFEKL